MRRMLPLQITTSYDVSDEKNKVRKTKKMMIPRMGLDLTHSVTDTTTSRLSTHD